MGLRFDFSMRRRTTRDRGKGSSFDRSTQFGCVRMRE
jgi:hypothetical protein